MLNNAYALATKVQQPGAAVSAVMALGKLHGLIVDRSKVDLTTPKTYCQMTDAQLYEIIEADRAAKRTGKLPHDLDGMKH